MSGEDRRNGLVLAVAAGLVLLHFLVRPYLLAWWAAPDLAVAALLLTALHMRPGRAATLGFVLGLLEGAMAMSGIGPLAMAYAVVGYAAARSWGILFADMRVFLPVYFFIGSLMLIVFNQWVTTGDLVSHFILVQAPVAALLTAAAAGVVEVSGGGLRA